MKLPKNGVAKEIRHYVGSLFIFLLVMAIIFILMRYPVLETNKEVVMMLIGTISASIGLVVSTITGAKPDDVNALKAELDKKNHHIETLVAAKDNLEEMIINLQKQILENNIQMALQQKQIEIEDAIDAREVKNLKLANQLLKLRRKKKFEKDRQLQMENIEAQSRSNAQAAQAAAQSEAQKEQVIMQGKAKMSEIEHQFEIQKLEREAEIKKELMFHEFQLNMQLKQAETQVINTKEEYKENRKDKRTKIQATQQSELINQRQTGKPPKDFESAGFDNLGGFGLEQFDPR